MIILERKKIKQKVYISKGIRERERERGGEREGEREREGEIERESEYVINFYILV